jgi:hypothetical protein
VYSSDFFRFGGGPTGWKPKQQANPQLLGPQLGDAVQDCLNQALQQTTPFDAHIIDLAKTWNPQPNFDPESITALVGAVTEMNGQALTLIHAVQQQISTTLRADLTVVQSSDPSTGALAAGCRADIPCVGMAGFIAESGIINNLNQGLDDIARNEMQGALYAGAVATAATTLNTSINAPFLKDWVLKSLQDASSAMNAATDSQCLIQNIPTVWGTLAAYFHRVVELAAAIVGKAIEIAGNVIKASEDIIKGSLGFLAFLSRNAIPIAIGAMTIVGLLFAAPRVKRLINERKALTP